MASMEITPRRLLPSTSALAAFDAVARTGSFTAAATLLDLTQGAITREMLAQALKPEELEALDREVAIAAWYPIGTYARLLRFLRDTVGDGSDEWLRRSGEESARRMVGLGIYGQLDERSEAWEKRVGKMMVTLAPAIFSFSHWAMEEADGGRSATLS